jgi:hypothetical protein
MCSITVFPTPIQRILDHKVAKVPIFQGVMEDDGSLFVLGSTDVGTYLNKTFGPGLITPAELAPLYPGISGFQEISRIERDFLFNWRVISNLIVERVLMPSCFEYQQSSLAAYKRICPVGLGQCFQVYVWRYIR